jgi:beta-galactosidase/beta-glucuronidase
VEQDWMAGSRLFLTFDGVSGAFYCWLNGAFLGFSKDSRVPAEFEVTGQVQPGANLLAVQVGAGGGGGRGGGGALLRCLRGRRREGGKQLGAAATTRRLRVPAAPSPTSPAAPAPQVMRWSDATYLEDQDMWRLSGIHRRARGARGPTPPQAGRTRTRPVPPTSPASFSAPGPAAPPPKKTSTLPAHPARGLVCRDVTLLAKPRQAHISDFSVRTPLAFLQPGCPALASAHLELQVRVAAAGADELAAAAVVYHLLDYETRAPLLPPGTLAVAPGHWYAADTAGVASRGAAGQGGVARLRLDVLAALAAAAGAETGGGGAPQLRLWSAEAPALYLLVLELTSGGGATAECETCQVGLGEAASLRRAVGAAGAVGAMGAVGPATGARCRLRCTTPPT